MPSDGSRNNASSSNSSSSASDGMGGSTSSSMNTGTSGLAGDETTAQDIKEKLSQLVSGCRSVHDQRDSASTTLSSIGKTHEKVRSDARGTKPYFRHKLKQLYQSAMSDCDTEAGQLESCLSLLHDIRSTVSQRKQQKRRLASSTSRLALMKHLQSAARTMPLFVPEVRGQKPPPLSGCIPADSSYSAQKGDLVAALIRSTSGSGGSQAPDDDQSNWILAEVVHFQSGSGRYDIDDIDDSSDSTKQRHNGLSRRRVVPLPLMRVNPDTDADALFEQNSPVLALYPQTTCFYRGIVHRVPLTPTDDYLILFEDPAYPDGYSPPLPVPQRYVIPDRHSSDNQRHRK